MNEASSRWKKIWIFVTIGVLLLIIKSIFFKTDGVEQWIGKYFFEEAYSEEGYAPMAMQYTITIYEESDTLMANIEIIGQTTWTKARCRVSGDSNEIQFLLVKDLNENMNINVNDSLLTLRKGIKGEIYTYWGKIKPMLDTNNPSGELYFERVDEK